MKNLNAKAIVQIALLIAVGIILNNFLTIQAPVVRTVNFGFLPIAIIAMLYGPLLAGVAGAVGDVLGFMMVPAMGPFFPGFTLSAFMTGVIYGLFIYKKSSLTRIVIAVAVVTVVVRMGLNILWLSMMWEEAFLALLPPRVIAALVMVPIQVLCIRMAASERFCAILRPKAAAS